MRGNDRRTFLKGIAVAGSAGLGLKLWSSLDPELDHIPINIGGPDFASGHLQKTDMTAPTGSPEKTKIVIAGGGIAGLSAAWWLKKQGFHDFVLLELEEETGGNARSDQNKISKYPLGAHYIPLPPKSAIYTRSLFEDMGIIQGYDENGEPVLDEYALCHAPKERLLIHGIWQDSLIPSFGVRAGEIEQIHTFQEFALSFSGKTGRDGKQAFSSPAALSSTDPEFTRYDQMSVLELLKQMNLNSEHLHWYLEYCCRDDFGTNLENTSTWALLHYFNARSGTTGEVVTWPAGNGHVASWLRDYLKDHIVTGAAVTSIKEVGNRTHTEFFQSEQSKFKHRAIAKVIISDTVICALPRPAAARVMESWTRQKPSFVDAFTYAPWVVANISLTGAPDQDGEVPLSWDNVSRNSYSLGYIVANHQSLQSRPGPVNITYYLPVTETEPALARRHLLDIEPSAWRSHIVHDLERMHSGIGKLITSINLWFWPHGMIRPVPGFITGSDRRAATIPSGKVFFAHSDLSGMSLFEEAQYHGVEAARAVLTMLAGHPEPPA